MRLVLAILCFLFNMNLIGQEPPLLTIKTFADLIERTELERMNEIVELVALDTGSFTWSEGRYSTIEYIVICIFHSSHGMSTHRIKFIEEIIKRDIEMQPNLKALFAYLKNDSTELDRVLLEEKEPNSYMSSLKLTMDISNIDYGITKNHFHETVDSFLQQFYAIEDSNDRLILPLTEILKQWYIRFPESFNIDVADFISTLNIRGVEKMDLNNFKRILKCYELSYVSKYRIDSRQFSCGSSSEKAGYLEFMSKHGINGYLLGLDLVCEEEEGDTKEEQIPLR